ncbi:dephospho-CoA kinase [Ruminococcaceae bacterium OttesenSCG-928-A16]|nr:dephospho-CoA kinase [Ruminococcaceae bacterium OttesenSCG-928-A16]
MLIVAITGRSGSGKSSVTAHYASLGYPTIDGDLVSREVTAPGSPCLAKLAQAFGADILAEDGTLLRQELGRRAFATPQANQLLLSITHPAITRALLQAAQQAKAKGATLFFVDGAMIVGEDFEKHCDKIIVVTSPERLAVSRIILRDGISKQAALNRLAAQKTEEQLVAAADYVIANDESLLALQQKANKVLNQLLNGSNAT